MKRREYLFTIIFFTSVVFLVTIIIVFLAGKRVSAEPKFADEISITEDIWEDTALEGVLVYDDEEDPEDYPADDFDDGQDVFWPEDPEGPETEEPEHIVLTTEEVLEVQYRLLELGYLEEGYDGDYGPKTRLAVKEFQLFNGLSVTGEPDEETRDALNDESAKEKRSLSEECTGEDVAAFQELLQDLGYLSDYTEGEYDETTRDGVLLFQGCNGLVVDGSAGPDTIEKLLSHPVSYEDYYSRHYQRPKDGGKHHTEDPTVEAAEMAVDVLNLIGWELEAAYRWAAEIPYTKEETGMTVSASAIYTFSNGVADCVGKAATFCVMARLLGYDACVVYGSVPLSTGDFGEHAWVELCIDGVTWVCDPEFEWDERQSGFLIYYGQPGTWMYQYDSVLPE